MHYSFNCLIIIVVTRKGAYLALASFRISVKELSDVGHDGLLVRTVHIHILRVEQLSYAELGVSHHEGGLETSSVTDVSHGLDINNSCKYLILSSHPFKVTHRTRRNVVT